MKKTILLLTVGVACAVAAFAGSPTYKTTSANGNAASPAAVILLSDPTTQIRVVSAVYTTDTNNSALSCSSGTTALNITQTNLATSSITNAINTTNGLTAGAILVLEHAGVGYAATLASVTCNTNAAPFGGTNVVLASGGWGVLTTPGDNVYVMSSATSIPAPAATSGANTTAAMNGEAIYVAALPGRPVRMVLTPAYVTNQLNNIVAHYD